MKLKVLTILLATVGPILGGTVETLPALPPVVESLAQSIFNSGGLILAAYPTIHIDPKAGSHDFGYGLAALYPVGTNAFAGLRLNYLSGNFWAPSATVGAKYVLTKVPSKPTVFTVGGLVMPLSGAGQDNKTVGAIAGVGLDIPILRDKVNNRWTIDVVLEAEKWTNIPGYEVNIAIAGGYKF